MSKLFPAQFKQSDKRKHASSTWTHRFVCYANHGQEMIPTMAWEKDILIGVGLGEKKKVLENVDCDAEEFKEVLITHFLKLVDVGGISYVNARLIHKI